MNDQPFIGDAGVGLTHAEQALTLPSHGGSISFLQYDHCIHTGGFT
jgi:hypothetical protein